MSDFMQFNLHPTLAKSLVHMKYSTPTPIQAQAIPLALKGRDIMGSAQTGTGKTAAFAIPMVEQLLREPDSMGLVLTPTRELGKQIMDVMKQLLGPKTNINTAFIIGGEPMGKQFKQLSNNPRLIVGTPGRINDHLDRGSMKLDKVSFLVLDETDRMLDMGFTVQIDRIVKFMPKERQTLMFSATLPKNILKMSESYLKNPERISVGSTNVPAKAIKQEVLFIEDAQKAEELERQLEDRTGSVIIFVKTKFGTEKLAKKIRGMDHTAEAIHGDLKQSKRDRVIQDFRALKYRVLVATDVVARGLDIPHIAHVINYDLPQAPEDYIHRIGRTARAGAEGEALCFISNADKRKWHAITRLIDPSAASSSGKGGAGKSTSRYSKPAGKPAAKKTTGRPYGNKPTGERSYGEKSYGEKSSFGDRKPTGDKPFGKKPVGEKSFGDRKPTGDKPFGKKPVAGAKPAGKRPDWKKEKPRSRYAS